MAHYGIGELTAPTILCELGDVTRLSSSRKAVRCAGIDIGVHRSDRRSRAGKLTQPGLAAAALGALPVSPGGVPPDQSRPGRLPGAQRARALAPPRFADYRQKARPALLPHPARTRPRRLGARSPDPDRPFRPPPIPQMAGSLPARSSGSATTRPTAGSTKNQRPESSPGGRPTDHHVAGHQAEHPDKPGRPRTDRTTQHQSTTTHPRDLTEAPVQISTTVAFLFADWSI